MKILVCLFALLVAVLARPQNLPFYQEGLQIGSRIQFLAPHDTVLDYGVVPLVNVLEDIPYTENVDLTRFLTGLDAPVASNLQRSVGEALS
ncbi:uncharacterized protein LOC109402726 isoform X2 [Aedes albopictus]|nr:uncharacterized protein LOC109402726 isoform X2 [Aedes albopictus]